MDDNSGDGRASCPVESLIVLDSQGMNGCGCNVDVSRQVIILYLLLKLCKEKDISPECFFHVVTVL